MKVIQFSFIICFSFLSSVSVSSQNLPGMPSNALDAMGDEGDSLAKMLKMDLMKRFLQPQNTKENSQRVSRPRPELGNRPSQQLPVDLSKYLGPDGDPNKAWQMLQDQDKVPADSRIPNAPIPNGTSAVQDQWDDVPTSKRLHYVKNLLERRRFQEMQDELQAILQQDDLPEEQKLEALVLREKAIFHNHHYRIAEKDYYRLKSYYPESDKVKELKEYLEKESGIQKLQEQVKNNIGDPKAHQQLINQYKRYGWLDFAEEFFSDEIGDTSETTVKSLSEIYFVKQDYQMLVKLSETAQTLHPRVADFAYNEGVGLYHLGDPISQEESLKAFQKALRLAPSPVLRQKMNWYLKRLMK